MIARRLLMGGGGSFPTPPAWTGVLTPGSISTITNDAYYNAWPIICRLQSGDLMVAYTKAIGHHTDNSGNAVFKLSSDDGASWGSELPIYSDTVTPLWSSIMGISQIASGRIFATLWRDNWNVAGTGEAGIVYSDDDGTTWTAWIDLTNGFTQEAYGAGPVVEIGSNLLVTIEGSNSGQAIADRSSHTVKSTDNGATWGSEVTVRNFVTDSRPYYESKLLLLDTGELICIHRCAGNAGLPHYISRSSDQGATTGGWGTPTASVAGFGAPSTIQSVTRTLLLCTRRDSNSSAIAYSSLNLGATWSSLYVLDATMFEMEYGMAVDTLTPGTTLWVYGYQPTSSVTNSDIKQIYVTEGLA